MNEVIKDDFIETELKKYNVSDAVLAKMSKEYMSIAVSGIDDVEGYMVAKEKHQEVKKLRIDIEKKRKELKASSLEFGRAVDGEAKRLTSKVEAIEDYLLSQRKVVEDEKERIKKEREDLARIEEERKQREELARIEAIKAEQEAKEEELRSQQAKIDAEKEEIARKQKEEQDRIESEKRAIEEEKRNIEIEKERIEREKQHAIELEQAKQKAVEQAKIDAENEAIKKKEAEEKVRVEAEEEAKRQEALKPDIEKIRQLGKEIADFVLPKVVSREAVDVMLDIRKRLNGISEILLTTKI